MEDAFANPPVSATFGTLNIGKLNTNSLKNINSTRTQIKTKWSRKMRSHRVSERHIGLPQCSSSRCHIRKNTRIYFGRRSVAGVRILETTARLMVWSPSPEAARHPRPGRCRFLGQPSASGLQRLRCAAHTHTHTRSRLFRPFNSALGNNCGRTSPQYPSIMQRRGERMLMIDSSGRRRANEWSKSVIVVNLFYVFYALNPSALAHQHHDTATVSCHSLRLPWPHSLNLYGIVSGKPASCTHFGVNEHTTKYTHPHKRFFNYRAARVYILFNVCSLKYALPHTNAGWLLMPPPPRAHVLAFTSFALWLIEVLHPHY